MLCFSFKSKTLRNFIFPIKIKLKAELNKKFISSKMEQVINNNVRLVSETEEKNLRQMMSDMGIKDSNIPDVPSKNIKVTSFGGRIRVGALVASDGEKWIGKTVTIGGWVKTLRVQGGGDFSFIEINDGSTIKGIQVVVSKSISNFAAVIKEGIGSCMQIRGAIVKSQGSKQLVRKNLN
jgi:hypothetical protein